MKTLALILTVRVKALEGCLRICRVSSVFGEAQAGCEFVGPSGLFGERGGGPTCQGFHWLEVLANRRRLRDWIKRAGLFCAGVKSLPTAVTRGEIKSRLAGAGRVLCIIFRVEASAGSKCRNKSIE